MRYSILLVLALAFFACTKQKETKTDPPIIICWFDTTNIALPVCVKSAVDSAMSRPKGSFFYSIDIEFPRQSMGRIILIT